jgi:uncharacterized membrane protein HdeD (DUF308 family)
MENQEFIRGTHPGREVSEAWGAWFFLGLIVTVLGVFSWVAAGVASLATVLFFGVLITVTGVLEIVAAFQRRKTGHFTGIFLSGLLSIAVGVMMLARPMAGLGAITLLLGGYFLASGLFRGLTAAIDRYADWGWDVLYGIVAIIAGAIVLRQWPISSYWVVGTLVGAVLFMRGIAMMGAALSLRRILRASHSHA